MHGDSPRETKRYLLNGSLGLPIFLYRPRGGLAHDSRPIEEFYDGHALMKSRHMTNRPIHIAFFGIIFHKHHTSPALHDEHLWSEASLLERFDKFLCTTSPHLIGMRLSAECCQSVDVVGINRDIAGKELGMVFGHHRNIPRTQEIFRKF